MKPLVVYESPNKFKTFSSMFEGMDVSFCYTQGRIYDLPDYRIGINKDLSLDLIPISEDRFKFLQKKIGEHSSLYCLTDNDPEGEWIALHIRELCDEQSVEFKRVRVSELTKDALKYALDNSDHSLDNNLLTQAVSRRTIDRVIGFHNNEDKQYKRGRIITPLINHLHKNTLRQQSTLLARQNGIEAEIEGETSKIEELSQKLKNMNSGDFFEESSIDSEVELHNTMDYLKERSTFYDASPQEAFEELQNMYECGNVSYTRTENKKYEVLNGEHKGIHFIAEIDVDDTDSSTTDGLTSIKLRTLLHSKPESFAVREYEPSPWLLQYCEKNNLNIKSISSIEVKPKSRHEIPKKISLYQNDDIRSRKRNCNVYRHSKELMILNLLDQLELGTPATFHTHVKKLSGLIKINDNTLKLNENGMRAVLQTDELSLRLSSLDVAREIDSLIFNNRLSIEDKCKKCLNVLRISDPTTSGLSLDN